MRFTCMERMNSIPPSIFPETAWRGSTASRPPASAQRPLIANNRRVLSLDKPRGGKSSYRVSRSVRDDGGTQSYNGMILSAQKRLSHNYTLFDRKFHPGPTASATR